MHFFSQILLIVRIEAGFFARFPKLLHATLVIALLPAIYTLIYLSSVWDPASHTQSLAVALVNLDRDIEFKGQTFNVGKEVVNRLKANKTFGYQELSDEQAVRQAVRKGKLAFAIIIPSDFSINAVPGGQQGAGKLIVYASEGNNYQIANLARRFADDMGHAVNDSLNERRWTLVLNAAAGSQHNIDRLREGVGELVTGVHELEAANVKLDEGAHALSRGARSVSTGVNDLSLGFIQLSAGLRSMDTNKPKDADLNRLKAGAAGLETGHMQFGQGFSELQKGSKRLMGGVGNFRAEADDSWLVPGRVVEGLDQLTSGVKQLDAGLVNAGSTHQKLTEGAKQLHTGVTALSSGVQAMNSGIHTIVIKLPKEHTVKLLTDGSKQLASGTEELADGTQKVRAGAQRLAAGIDLLADSVPSFMQKIEGSAEGMTHSVQPQVEVDADVPNQGSSFAPNIIPAALWLGAGIIAFLVHVRVLPNQAESFSRPAQLIGKMIVPSLIVLLQALTVLVTVQFVMKINILHFWPFVATMATASLTFLCIVFAMTRALGDAGKALAMLFLAVQLSSSGGVLPVELSGGFFASISPWLPMTWVVKALKASMFGAYDDAWQLPLLLLLLAGIVAVGFASVWGRWRFVDSESVRPAVDF